MFVVTSTRATTRYFLSRQGWTTEQKRALTFPTRGRANAARRRAFKSRQDQTDIMAADVIDALPDCVAAAMLSMRE